MLNHDDHTVEFKSGADHAIGQSKGEGEMYSTCTIYHNTTY